MTKYIDPQYEINKKFALLEKEKYGEEKWFDTYERFYDYNRFEDYEIDDLNDLIEYIYDKQ
jgi:hypothetical protein